MADLALSTVDDDLLIENDNLSIIDGTAGYEQNLVIRFRFFKGDWFLDLRLGVPYYDDIFLKNPDLILVRTIFREIILETAGTDSIERFDLSVDSATRIMSMSFTSKLITGEIIDFSREFLIG